MGGAYQTSPGQFNTEKKSIFARPLAERCAGEFFQKGRDFLQNEGWFMRGVGTLNSIREVEASVSLYVDMA